MKPGLRVDLIRRLSTAMAEWPYHDIALVFKNFDIPLPDYWSGETTVSLLTWLSDAKDESLIILDEYLHSPQNGQNEETPVWTPTLFRLFLSHSTADKVFVAELKTALSDYGIDGFVAHVDIMPSAEWLQSIIGALDTCDALAAILTKEFPTSNWCEQEVGYCIGMHKLIVPLDRGHLPYGFMGRFQALRCGNESATDCARKVFDILIANPQTSSKMSEAIIANLGASGSFAQARNNLSLVRKIANWTPDLLRKLDDCLENSQVSGSFNVPEGIRSIINQHSSPTNQTTQDRTLY
jgi:hypothetical protein